MTPTVVLLPPLGHEPALYDAIAAILEPRIRVIGVGYPLDDIDLSAPDLLESLADRLVSPIAAHAPALIGGISLGATLCYLLVDKLPRPPHGVLLMAPGGAPAGVVRREGVLGAMEDLGEVEFVRRHLGGDVAHAKSLCALLRAALAGDFTARMSRLSGRIDVVWGSDDRLFNLAYMNRVRRALPSHRFHELSGVGHYAAAEAPDRVAAIIDDALNQESA